MDIKETKTPVTVPVTVAKRSFAVTAAAMQLMLLAVPGSVEKELETRGIILGATATALDNAATLLRADGVSTQSHYAAWIINLTHGEGGSIAPDQLTQSLKEAFPGASINERHGPHYLSHARKGRLQGLRADLEPIPFARKKIVAKVVEKDVPIAAGEQPAITAELLMKDNDRKTLQEMAKGLEVSAGGKTLDIAKRIADAMNIPAASAEAAA